MSTARCSSCHCFVRNCPPGLPNHNASTAIGQSCPLNSLGRHYRDPSNPDEPSCNYEQKGVKCSFFTTNEFASLPYPEDVTYGPPTTQAAANDATALQTVIDLLNRNKAEADAAREEQNRNIRDLQQQITALSSKETPQPSQPNCQPPTCGTTSTQTTVTSLGAQLGTTLTSALSFSFFSKQ